MKRITKFCCIMLALAMLLGLAAPAAASSGNGAGGGGASSAVSEVAPNEKTPSRSLFDVLGNGSGSGFKHLKENASGKQGDVNGQVRVSIVLDDESAVEAGYDTATIGLNPNAISYRSRLRQRQNQMEKKIEREVLGGEPLDVVWHLTLAANLISAYVPRIAIDEIADIPGVKSVVEERLYLSQPVSVGGELQPNMALSSKTNGSQTVWNSGSGYTGAGTKIAIIDTGLDIDHISFSSAAFDHAISTLEGFDEALLLDKDDITKVLSQLNAYDRTPSISAGDLYKNSKVPFGYNYIDDDAEYISHMDDEEGEHGSHVAGIAAANRFITKEDGTFEDALDTVLVTGNAPDAQILVMKVFGRNGGSYDSDYMAAIEDAITLGVDAINLSLGGAMAGMSTDKTYQDIMDRLAKSNTVLAVAAGNTGDWSASSFVGNLYNDDVNFDTVGVPGSYTNSFTVASVDNDGFIGPKIEVDDEAYDFSDASFSDDAEEAQELPSFATLDASSDQSGTECDFVILAPETGGEEDSILSEEDVKDKVVIVWRGETSFTEKAMLAVSMGAKGVLIANNAPGYFGAQIDGYTGEAPVASITQAAGLAIWDSLSDQEDGQYRTGEMTVTGKTTVVSYESDSYTMSSFSSWGVPGDLSLKPEITAPGGNIYSVWGANAGGGSGVKTDSHSGYELMSGTSMASPQIAGMVALVQQYLREHQEIRLEGLNTRALTQSLLMSTARQLKDEEGNYYPVIQQGAGLAAVDRAVSTPVTITVANQPDGKVKVELGDDPTREGKYTFQFTLHNLKDTEQQYTLSADVFTQLVDEGEYGNDEEGGEDQLMFLNTRKMEANVTFNNGSSDQTVTVPAKGSLTVNVTISLSDSEKQQLAEENPAGAYVEAFIHMKNTASPDGATDPDLGIPVLGYYGSWSEPSMYDIGQIESTYEDRYPYLYGQIYPNGVAYVNYANPELEMFDLPMWGNPLSEEEWESEYYPEHNAMSSEDGSKIVEYEYSLIRGAGDSFVRIANADTGAVYYEKELGSEDAAFSYSDGWAYVVNDIPLNWAGTDAQGNPLPEGTPVNVTVYHAPELYADEDGNYDWDALTGEKLGEGELAEGAYLNTPLVIDNTAPQLVASDVTYDEDEDAGEINLTLKDNRHIAAIALYYYDPDEDEAIGIAGELLEQESSGEEYTVSFDTIYDEEEDEEYPLPRGVYLMDVYDYAMNVRTYRIFVGVESTSEVENVVISDDAIELYAGSTYQLSAQAKPYTLSDCEVSWSSNAPKVATVNSKGRVTAVEEGTAIITAAANVDPTVTATCTVTVKRVHATAEGVLADQNGDPHFFTYNFATETLKMGEAVDEYPLSAADLPNDKFYMADPFSTMYLMDKYTGQAIEEAPQEFTPWDLAYVDGVGMFSIYGANLLGPSDDPLALQAYGWDFEASDYVSFFTGLAVDPNPWTYEDEDGEQHSGDFSLYAIDDLNSVWHLMMYQDEDGVWRYYGNSFPSDLAVSIPFYEGAPYSSLVVGDDGVLYFSAMTGNTSEFYRLEYVDDPYNGPSYKTARLGSVGDEIWPAILLNVSTNPSIPYPVPPSTPNVTTGEVTEDGQTGTETTAVPNSVVSGGTASATVSGAMGDEIVKQAQANDSDTVVVAPKVNGNVDRVAVTLPGKTVRDLADKTSANLRVETPVGNVTIPHEALDDLGKSGNVTVTVEKKTDGSASVDVSVGGQSVESVPGGLKAALPLKDGEVAVLVGADGSETILPKSLVENGTTHVVLDGPGTVKVIDNTKTFADVRSGAWYAQAVDFVSSHELFNGVSSAAFAPETDMSRAMLATVLWRMESEKDALSGLYFSDVTAGAWYTEGVAWASGAGIVLGNGDGTFAPDRSITREEMAAMLYRYADSIGLDVSGRADLSGYTDASGISGYARDAMAWAVSAGLIKGVGGNCLDPTGNASRAQVATVLQRIICLIVK